MSVKLTTNRSQRLVLTPQLRQRIEMLQMTSLELSDLIQQQMLENPVLEEVPSQEETRELAEKILDQLANGDPSSSFDMTPAEALLLRRRISTAHPPMAPAKLKAMRSPCTLN